MAQLTLEKLSVGYGASTVVGNISLTVQGGDFVCVIGNNGSGKTTLMKTVLGLIPPVSGSVAFGDGLKRDEIGYMPQLSSAQRDFPASVGEIVLSGCAGRCGLRPFYSRAEKAMAQAAMEKIGIADLKKRCYRELSGGQQQRVLIARALCATKKLMILDEPASGLDASAARDMYSLIQDINRDGITVIMILHDISAAVSYASKILSIGDDIFYGTPDEYRRWQGGVTL